MIELETFFKVFFVIAMEQRNKCEGKKQNKTRSSTIYVPTTRDVHSRETILHNTHTRKTKKFNQTFFLPRLQASRYIGIVLTPMHLLLQPYYFYLYNMVYKGVRLGTFHFVFFMDFLFLFKLSHTITHV